MELLTRDEFRNAVFTRDGHKCVVCGAAAKDAHHIIERRLWPDGGYYLANGASVCEKHHLAAESTTLSCDELRERCGIAAIALPPHLYSDQAYDKWGNPVLPNGQRLRGELFEDSSVQRVLDPVLHLFTSRVKYPRTYHLPWSPGVSKDDRVMEDLGTFQGEEVVVTIKMDGEQTTLDREGFHARSLDTPSHPSRDWLWGVHRRIGHDIPTGWRVCGENLYAAHSIKYQRLPAHFLVFSIWDDRNTCLSWKETAEWAALLELPLVPWYTTMPWNEHELRKLSFETWEGDPCEGYVVRVSRAFHYSQFRRVVGKWVRKDHVHTHGHWMRRAIEVNGLTSSNAT